MKKFMIKTLGCKVNSYESEFIRTLFLNKGYTEVENGADVIVVNTCTVTNTADNKSKKVINNVKEHNGKNAIVVACGCFCENNKEKIEDLINADIILGNKDKSHIVEYVEDFAKNKKRIIKMYDMSNVLFEDMEIKKYEHNHRAFVKIEDGCNNFCSYCIIPYVRGRVRSKDFNTCLIEFNDIALNGHKEIVLSGIHTGQYNSNGKRLSDLINEISKIDQIKRIRLSSVEITELDDGMMKIIENNPKFVSHLHIPLQSGCNKILKLMNRKYDLDYFTNKVNEIRKYRKDISLTTDVIVGFPGESEEDFLETYNYCKSIGFAKIHVFPYSDRNGTVASRMENKVPGNIKKDRARRLISLSQELENAYIEKFISRKISVLIEREDNGYYYGVSEEYIPVKLKGIYECNEIYDIILEKNMIDDSKII